MLSITGAFQSDDNEPEPPFTRDDNEFMGDDNETQPPFMGDVVEVS